MAAVERAAILKAWAVDLLVGDETATGYYGSDDQDSALWPVGSTLKNANEKEEDLYGYEDRAPNRRASMTDLPPRRSSLKTSRSGARRASISFSGEMTLNLPLAKVVKKRSSITFNDECQVHEIEPVADMVDDPNRLWFRKHEYFDMQQKISAMIDDARKAGKGKKADFVCFRGLEPWVGGSSYYERKDAYDNVLGEQEMQKSRGNYDDEHIRTIYQFHTVDSQILASERAAKDAKDVEAYLELTRQMCLRLSLRL